ncbi:hypothetical protein ASE63_16075 [Bosea sp. Root381]|uniref:hypothetical protein n=1 Tax=Bosea sp. Root381 TaxID=1736524 RepID=UPI0006F901F3|nr:hypothetical protein [Bosea sp. Root381]KRE15757.1 hypothetical protein ASE63_16075 [Bosea sp. Root381]
MKHRPAADFIPKLGIEEAGDLGFAEAVTEAAAEDIELPAFLPKTPREPPPDLDAIFASGRQAGLAEARAEAEAQLAALRQEAAASLEEARQRWAEEVATPLTTQVPEALDALGERLADATGRLLRPFFDSELRDAASRALIDQIRPLLAGDDGMLIRVSGPAALLETLRHVFPAGCAVEFVENDATDVRIVAGETTIETRIAAWVARLEGTGPDRRRRKT